MRNIDITKQDIRCCPYDFYVEPDNINVGYELWFDVDEYFGTNTHDNDSVWINFYTYYNKDGSIEATYAIDSDTDYETFDWELTDEEKIFFKNKMEEYCMKYENCTLDELFE